MALVVGYPLNGQANPAATEEVAHMKAGQTIVAGVVTSMKFGLYTIRTGTGTNYTLSESVEVRYGLVCRRSAMK